MSRHGHSPCLLGLYVATAVMFVIALTFSFLSSNPSTDLFERTASNVSEIYNLQITPASWTFSIWGFIYAWQALWLLYAFTLVCRRGRDGYLYVSPGVLPVGLLIAFCVSCSCVLVWLFMWDRLFIDAAVGVIFLATFSLHTALVFGHHRLDRITPILVQQGNNKDVWFVRMFVLNGIAFFNTWVSTASCFNFAQVMAYAGSHRVTQEAASTAALVLLTVFVFVWFILKNFVFERHLRFTFSPFIVLPIAILGIITKNWDRNTGNSLFTAMLLVVVGIMFIISVIITIVKVVQDRKRPSPYNIDTKM